MGLISNFVQQASTPRPLPPNFGTLPALLRFMLVAGSYYALSELAQYFIVLPGVVSPFWPAAAIGLYGCLRWGSAMAAAVWVGALLGMLSAGLALLPATVIGIGFALQAVAGAILIRRLYPQGPNFIYHRSILRFVFIALLTASLGALIGIGGLALANTTGPTSVAVTWLHWWIGNVAGMVVVMPLLLTWNITAGIHWHAAKIGEALAFALTLAAATHLVFQEPFGAWPLAYLPLPFVLWAAFRFNLSATAWSTAVICVFAVWNTAAGRGPFASDDLNASLLLLMSYVCVIGTTGLALANAVYQRSRAEAALLAERDSLERRVQLRTEALLEDIEARKRIEQRLATREKQLEDAQRLAQVGSWNWDVDTGAITWSKELYRIFGVDKAHFTLTPQNIRPLIHPQGLDTLRTVFMQSVHTGLPFRIEHAIVQPGGATRYVSSSGLGVKDHAGRVVRMLGTMQDVTDARQAEAALREAEERYRHVVELSPDAILVEQDDILVFANRAAVTLLGSDKATQLTGRPLFDLLHPDFHAAMRERITAMQRGEKTAVLEGQFVRSDGRGVDVEISASPFQNRGRFASLFLARDIGERKKTAEQMAYLAHYDSLTGLPNRMLFRQRLEHALTIAERPERSLEVLFLDLDRFKHINDTLGHAAGDEILQETAARLQGCLRESDTVARLGGDEFVVLVENVDEPHRGGTIAKKILAAFVPPFMRHKHPLTITTSIGISSFPTDGTDADTLLKKADIAMYRSKETDRNSYCYYSPTLNRHTTERLSLEHALSHAIEHDELSLHYQPKVDMVTNRITGTEALLRWRHPTLGNIPPQHFIPVAEETGLIRPIGYWTLRTACQQNRQWQDLSPARLKVAVNLSPAQLADDDLAENIREILSDTGLDPHYLELEITEGAVMSDPEKTFRLLESLRAIGVSVVIDDFGVGYSSFSSLKRLPIRAVKIDRSFVQGVPFDRSDCAITKAIINLAHSLECSVIAEGAETQQQYDFLREQNCDTVQGHYFSEAMPAEHFGDLIKVQSNLYLH